MKYFFGVLLALLFFAPAFALEGGHSISLGLETSSYTYKEPNDQTPVKHSGRLYGASAAYNYTGDLRPSNVRPLFEASLTYMQGKTDYDGWAKDISGNPLYEVHQSGIGVYYIESAVKAGSLFRPDKKLSFAPYMGLGARYLVDKGESMPGGYRRTSTYFYVPFGLNTNLTLPRAWSLVLNTEFDWMLLGKQRSRLSDVNPTWSNVTNEQTQGYGLRLSLMARKDYKKISVFAQPFWRYWHIQQSDEPLVDLGGTYVFAFEPPNRTYEHGLKLGIIF